MAETRAYLKEVFGADVAGIIDAFFVPIKRGDKQLAQYGYYEDHDLIKDINAGLRGACKGGNTEIVRALLSNDAGPYFDGEVTIAAFAANDPDIPELVRKYANIDWNDALAGACQGGHRELAEKCIAAGARDWDDALVGACRGGHWDMVGLCVAQRADNTTRMVGMRSACRGGHAHIVTYMINRGCPIEGDMLYPACRSGNRALVDLLISYGAADWDAGLLGACRGGHTALAAAMIARGSIHPPIDQICHSGNVQLLDLFYAPWTMQSLNDLLASAAVNDHLHIIAWAIDRGANDLERALRYACEGGAKAAVKNIVERGATNIKGAVRCAAATDHFGIVVMLVEMRRDLLMLPET